MKMNIAKTIVFYSFIFLILSFQNYSKKKTDVEKDGLSGTPKEVKIFWHEAKNESGKIIPGKELKQFNVESLYNQSGNKIEERNYYEDGTLMNSCIYQYDDKGNRIEKRNYTRNHTLYNKETYKYDGSGNLVETLFDGLDSLRTYKTMYKYDKLGRISEEKHFAPDNTTHTNYIYYKGKNVVESGRLDSNGKFHIEVMEKYNHKNNLIEYRDYEDDGKLGYAEEYKYDEVGNLSEEHIINYLKDIESKTTYKYEFDKYKNWIKQVEFWNDTAKYIRNRGITYY